VFVAQPTVAVVLRTQSSDNTVAILELVIALILPYQEIEREREEWEE
jgi:hypothetical protein